MVLLLKNLLFTLLAPGTVAVAVPLLIAGGRTPATGGRLAVALCLFALGGGVYAWCVWDFATFGRGTPAPIDAPKRLVARGLYRVVRNPMYVGVLTVILAWATLFGAAVLLGYAALVAVVFHLFIVLYEEPRLERAFGSDFTAYKARVRRWVPGPPRTPTA